MPKELWPPVWELGEPGQRIRSALRAWSRACPRPFVIFIDEIDALADQVLMSVLRQLRSGYGNRPKAFPHSLALIGLRDVRDYKVKSGGSERLGTASPFNIKVESLTLQNFTLAEVTELYAQHTADTGQVFLLAAIERVHYLTDGQPWLVNAIARQCVKVLVPERSMPITVAHVEQAKEILIQRQDTHLDSLAERLREARIRQVIEPMILGRELGAVLDDDRQFLVDLGLVKRLPLGGLVIANPIYREVLPRVLSRNTQDTLPMIQPSWLTATGRLDVEALLAAFLAFWRQHGQPLLRSVAYHEIAPHIVMMAFLSRVANGAGTIEREYAIGMGRLDLCLRYGDVTVAIELKVWRDGERDPLEQGLVQIEQYLAGLGLETGWLVIFDQRSGLGPISDRTTVEEARTATGREIKVIRA